MISSDTFEHLSIQPLSNDLMTKVTTIIRFHKKTLNENKNNLPHTIKSREKIHYSWIYLFFLLPKVRKQQDNVL